MVCSATGSLNKSAWISFSRFSRTTAARAGESETYLAALRLALQSLPNDPDALYQIGVEEKKRGRPEESRKVFSKVSTLDVRPDQLEARDRRIQVLAFPAKSISIGEVAQHAESVVGNPAIASASYNPPTVAIAIEWPGNRWRSSRTDGRTSNSPF